MGTPEQRAPIYEMLEKHAGGHPNSFHVPGHKQRADWGHETAASRYAGLLPFDLTELPDTDDLHHPLGPIEEAQRLAADCFGAEETRFLVGGSTAGNLAMILGTAEPGDLLIVQRNVHRSVIHGLMLAGARAVLLPPEIDEASGLAVIPNPDTIQEALARYPEAKGVLLSSPNYYGMSGDLHTMAKTCHAAGKLLLVDEAHGAHFGFHPSFPPSALKAGADVVVQSAHKTLNAMTMGAMLHLQGNLVRREPIRQALRMVQSSSPSFPLLASLDLARRQLHMERAAAFEPALSAVTFVHNTLPRTTFRALAGKGQDPLKLVLYDDRAILSGFQIRDELEACGCVMEMADSRYAVAAFGTGSRIPDGEALAAALVVLTEYGRLTHLPSTQNHAAVGEIPSFSNSVSGPPSAIPQPVIFNRSAMETERIPLEECAGRTAGEWIVPYPPGVPELFPGEPITGEAIIRLQRWRKAGARIQGAEDPELAFLRVWR